MTAKRPASASGNSWRKWERQPWDEPPRDEPPRVRWWEPVLVWAAVFAMLVVAVLGGVFVR